MQILPSVFTQHVSFDLYYNNCSNAKLQIASISTDLQESLCDGNKYPLKKKSGSFVLVSHVQTVKSLGLLLIAIKIFSKPKRCFVFLLYPVQLHTCVQ